MGGPTLGWLRQAFRSMAALEAPGVLERIAVPVLLVSADADRIVDAASHKAVAARLRDAELVVVDGARHEILMETDAHRAPFWSAFDRLAGRVCG